MHLYSVHFLPPPPPPSLHLFSCILLFYVFFCVSGKLGEAESVCADALSIVDHNKQKGEETPHLMAALLKLQSKILKRQGQQYYFSVGVRWLARLLRGHYQTASRYHGGKHDAITNPTRTSTLK